MTSPPTLPAARFRGLRTVCATLSGNLYLVVGSLFFSLVAIVASLLPPRGRHAHGAARLWARGALAASLVPLRIEFEAPLEAGRPYVFVANHASLFDIPALLAAIPGQVRFLAKAGLFRIPVFGWAMRLAGFVPVDRGHRERARDSFALALDRLDRGLSILVFPEERRSLDGRLLPFKRGGMLLAAKSGLPIVPVGLEGAFEVQPMRSFAIHPRPVFVRFGRPLPPPASIRELRALTAGLRQRVAELAGTTVVPAGTEPSTPTESDPGGSSS